MLCQYSLPFRAQFCQLLGLDLARSCRQLVLVTVTVTIITVKAWAEGGHCGLLSTNAGDFDVPSDVVYCLLRSASSKSNWDLCLTAHMFSFACLPGGPSVALVSQPASGRDASRRIGTRATTINHAQGAALQTLNPFQSGCLTRASR